VSISDYCFMIDPESVLTDRGGYRYLVRAPGSHATRTAELGLDDSISDTARDIVACALAVLFLGLLAGAIWYAYYFPYVTT
jgi:hypothetical protein